MKVVVDTNIVFSAILNSSSEIAKILLNAGNSIEFYSCDFLKEELFKHRHKIEKLTKLPPEHVQELLLLVTQNIHFINESLISLDARKKAHLLIVGLDLKDMPFVALTYQLKAILWTGDQKLRLGLSKKGYKNTVDTRGLLKALTK